MTRSAVLTQYRPIRAGIQRVLRLAANTCKRADLTRAVKQVALGQRSCRTKRLPT